MTVPSNEGTLERYPRLFLLFLSLVNLAIGLWFYVAPSTAITYWPWPVKALAVRFLGAIFIAISLGCWSALRSRVWQRAKILILVGGTFFTLTGLVSIAQNLTANSDVVSWVWAIYFLAAGTSCLLLLRLYRWHRRSAEPTRKKLLWSRIFFAIQTSVVGIFGIMMVVVPAIAQEQFWPWKVATPTLQTFGALFLATCIATGWAFSQRDPARIVVLLPLDAIFPSLALLAVGIGWSTIVAESPSSLVTGVWVFLYSFVALGSTILFFTLRKQSTVRQ